MIEGFDEFGRSQEYLRIVKAVNKLRRLVR